MLEPSFDCTVFHFFLERGDSTNTMTVKKHIVSPPSDVEEASGASPSKRTVEEAKEEEEAPEGEETTAEEEVEEDPPIKLYKSTRLKGTYDIRHGCCLGVNRMHRRRAKTTVAIQSRQTRRLE
jgi:hypothetical protein